MKWDKVTKFCKVEIVPVCSVIVGLVFYGGEFQITLWCFACVWY